MRIAEVRNDADGSPSPSKEQIAKALNDTARWLEQGHWTQGALWRNSRGNATETPDPNGSACLMGALLFQTRGKVKVYRDVCALVNEELRSLGELGMPSWNDAPGRKIEEVIALLDKVGAECH